MSKLDRLIAELCPEGVENKYLGDVATYSTARISATDVNANSYVGVDNLLQDKRGKSLSNYVPKTGMLTQYEVGDILIGNIRPYLKKIWLSDCVGGTNGDVLVIRRTDREVDADYLYYVLSSDQFFIYNVQYSKGAKMPRGNKEEIMRYSIPLPPIPVQREIVHILDNFTELTAELTTELTARKKQHEYNRNELLTFGTDVPMVTLGEIAKITDGTHRTPKYQESGIPFLSIKDMVSGYLDFSNTRYISVAEHAELICRCKPEKGDLLLSKVGTTGVPAVIDTDREFSIFVSLALLKPKPDSINVKYLKYIISSEPVQVQCRLNTKGSANKNWVIRDIAQTKIPLPPISEQERIVSILDRFDALTTDISNGLPAEIAARQKQYEYYRDKLLSFLTKQPVS